MPKIIRKPGRPKKEDGLKRTHEVKVCMSDYEYDELRHLCQITGLKPAQALRNAIGWYLLHAIQGNWIKK